MGRSEAVNRRMRDRSQQRILKTALTLFATHGYAGTSIRMIADKAGISVGLLYNYFPTKADLLIAIMEQSMVDVQTSFARAEQGPASQRIELLVRGAFDIVRTNRDFWRLSYGVRMQPAVVRGLGRKLKIWTATIQETLARFLSESGSQQADLDAAILFALIDGVSQHYVLDPENYPLGQAADRIIALFAGPRVFRSITALG